MAFGVDEIRCVADDELVCAVKGLVKADRMLSAKLLVHLGELHARELYLARGFSTMFEYCRSELRMSEAEAYLRILAAKVGRRFPLVLERFGEGAVNLTAIKLLAPYLTEENHAQLLERVKGLRKRHVEVLVAALAPKPDVPARLRKLPAPRAPIGALLLPPQAANASAAAPSSLALLSPLMPTSPAPAASPPTTMSVLRSSQALASQVATAAAVSAPTTSFALQSPRARACTSPLSPGRFKLELTLGQDGHDTLEQLRDLLRHRNPSGDLTSIVERALRELLEREMKRRFAQGSTPKRRVMREHVASKPDARASGVRSGTGAVSKQAIARAAIPGAKASGICSRTGATSEPAIACAEPAMRPAPVRAESTVSKVGSRMSRYIPREVLREVHARDGGQCTFVSSDGRRCCARGFLEVHHHGTTFARGGAATAENLCLACREHNLFLATRDYCRGFMQRRVREAVAQRSGSCKTPVRDELVESTSHPELSATC